MKRAAAVSVLFALDVLYWLFSLPARWAARLFNPLACWAVRASMRWCPRCKVFTSQDRCPGCSKTTRRGEAAPPPDGEGPR